MLGRRDVWEFHPLPARRRGPAAFGAAVALDFFAERAADDVGEAVAVFGGEDQPAFTGECFDGAPPLSGGVTISQARSSASAGEFGAAAW